MTDETAQVPANDAAQPSQVIEPNATDPSAQGKGVHLPEVETPQKEDKPASTRDAIAKAFDEAEARSKADKEAAEQPDGKDAEKDAKAEEKPDEKAKPEKSRGDDGKFAKAEKAEDAEPVKADKGEPEKAATERGEPDERRQSEGRKHVEPPARFLPEARTKWANVPNEVKAEFHRVSQEYESEISEHKQFREELKDYEDLAKQHNVTIKGTLDRYVTADRMLHQDFGRGVSQLAQSYGHNPVQAIAAILQANGISPMQYAQHVQQNPQAHQAPAPRPQQPVQPQQPQSNEELEALRQEIQMMKAEQTVSPIIQKFQSEHPDYPELEGQIVQILKSGVIDQIYGTGLSPEQKLAEAYRMAGGNASPSRSEPEPVQEHSRAEPVPSDDAGTKSIKGAPSGGKSPETKWKPKSNREALERAFASVR